MNGPDLRVQLAAPASRTAVFVTVGLIVVATLAAYSGTFSAPFVLDDLSAIPENKSLRSLWPIWPALNPPASSTVNGRPFLNLSLALNYAISGEAVWSYHLANLAIHLLAGLTLFGIVRRTLTLPDARPAFRAAATPLAGAIAALWMLHPLQTESVTYVVQRAESLVGLLYLLTLYAFIRATSSPRPRRWFLLSWTACLLGMATKEVMVSAPLIVAVYDTAFLSGGSVARFRTALVGRRTYYIALAATWVVLVALVVGASNRSGSAGFGTRIPWDSYALTQCEAIVRYLALSFWPAVLVFDYGAPVVRHASEVWLQASLLVVLAAGTFVALWRRPALGFLGLGFLAILAPSSSVVPIASQTMAEHRMYLPLAAVVALTVLGVHAWLGRRSLVLWPALAAVLGWVTFQRNEVYRTDVDLWADTVAKRPENARAQSNLGSALSHVKRFAEAIPHYEEALRLDPDRVLVRNAAVLHNSLGHHLATLGRRAEALPHYREALRLDPNDGLVHQNLGDAFTGSGQFSQAETHYREALRLGIDAAATHAALGYAVFRQGRTAEAIPHYRAALQLDPGSAPGHNSLAYALLSIGSVSEAVAEYREAVRLDPRYTAAHLGLGYALIQAGRPAEALASCEEALRLQPEFADAHTTLGLALAQLGRNAEAMTHFENALVLDPNLPDAHNNLANLLSEVGRSAEAITHYREAVRLNPDYADAHHNLAAELANTGHPNEAARHFEIAERLRGQAATRLAPQSRPPAAQ